MNLKFIASYKADVSYKTQNIMSKWRDCHRCYMPYFNYLYLREMSLIFQSILNRQIIMSNLLLSPPISLIEAQCPWLTIEIKLFFFHFNNFNLNYIYGYLSLPILSYDTALHCNVFLFILLSLLILKYYWNLSIVFLEIIFCSITVIIIAVMPH